MTVLMSVHSSEGCEGQCDGKCYNAKGGKCTCICGGKNHGVGLEQAIDNTREQFLGKEGKEEIEKYCKEHGLNKYTLEFSNDVKWIQETIFSIG